MNKPIRKDRKPPFQERHNKPEALPRKKQDALDLLDTLFREDKAFQGAFAMTKPKHLRWDAECAAVKEQVARAKGDYLVETVLDNPTSVQIAMLEAASIGLSWRRTLRQVYLTAEAVGGRKTALCNISYIGFEYLALKSGAVKQIQTELVYANDIFRRGMNRDGTNWVEYEPARTDRGELQGGFCRALMANGTMQIEHMDVGEIQGCADAAAAMRNGNLPATWSGPFRSEMEKKCIVRRAAKHWIIGENLSKAMEIMDRNEPMDFDAAVRKAEENKVVAEEPVEPLNAEDVAEVIAALPEVPAGKVQLWIKLQAEAWGYKELSAFSRERKADLIAALRARYTKIVELQAKKAGKEQAHAEHP